MLRTRNILCPIDFSEASMYGLEEAVEYARHFDAALCLVHVMNKGMPWGADAAGYFLLLPELQALTYGEANKKLQAMVQELNERGVRGSYVIRTGDTAAEIVNLAHTLQANLIVMATHCVPGWKRILFGSVAEKVVRYARCQVLTVPARERKIKPIQGKRLPLPYVATGERKLPAAARLKLILPTSN